MVISSAIEFSFNKARIHYRGCIFLRKRMKGRVPAVLYQRLESDAVKCVGLTFVHRTSTGTLVLQRSNGELY